MFSAFRNLSLEMNFQFRKQEKIVLHFNNPVSYQKQIIHKEQELASLFIFKVALEWSLSCLCLHLKFIFSNSRSWDFSFLIVLTLHSIHINSIIYIYIYTIKWIGPLEDFLLSYFSSTHVSSVLCHLQVVKWFVLVFLWFILWWLFW